jgi:hypothetical protein
MHKLWDYCELFFFERDLLCQVSHARLGDAGQNQHVALKFQYHSGIVHLVPPLSASGMSEVDLANCLIKAW